MLPNPAIETCEELIRNSGWLRLLFEVSESIATHRHLPTLCRDLARRLPAIVPFESIALFLHDPRTNVMRVHMLGTAVADSIPPGLEFPVDQSYSGLVFTTQQAAVVQNRDEAARFPTTRALVEQVGVESFCMLPLTSSVRPIGAMGFGSTRRDAFSESALEMLQLVVRQVAVAVDNVLHEESAASVQEQLSRERDRLKLLLEVSESIAAHRNLDDLFRDLARRLPRVVPFDYINLLLHDAVKDVMRLQLLIAPKDSTIQPGLELRVDESIAGLVWRTQEPVAIGNLREETRFPQLTSRLLENGVESVCTVPLTTALRRLGTLGCGSLTPRVYSREEITFLQQVAAQVAVAVDNVLHDESERAAQQQLTRDRDRQRLLLEVNNAIVTNLDLEDLFRAVSTCLRRVIPHDGSSLVLHEPDMQRYRVHVLQFANDESFVEVGRRDEPDCSPCRAAIESRRPVIFDEAQLRAMLPDSSVAEYLLAQGTKTLCSLPLESHDRGLGVLNITSLRSDAFSKEDVELLTQVSQQISIAVENALAYQRIAELTAKLNTEKLYLEDEIRTEGNFDQIIGQSEALNEVLRQVEIVAPTDSTVLIQGETGTGKELIARAIHDLSGRKARTFVKLNCAAIPTGLLESELFGHERGAFTGAIAQKIGRFELANGGTLFLDEVGDIPLDLQSKFLRVLQEQEFERLGATRTIRVDIRLVAATNRDLAAMVDQKEFRSDLYYRLNVFPIATPPLRERTEDVAPLVRHFTKKFARRMNKPISTVPVATMNALSAYHWPGNVRELENFVERAVILSRGTTLDAPLAELKPRPIVEISDVQKPIATLEDSERELIRRALQQANWRIGGPSGAAAKLGMKRTTLQSKMAKLGIARPSVS